jgi:hypothetical protein
MLEEKVKALLDAAVQKMYTAGVELDIHTMRQAAGEINAYYEVLKLIGIDMQQYRYSIRKEVNEV